jgi:DNA-binding NarL/FixJ family response regulator
MTCEGRVLLAAAEATSAGLARVLEEHGFEIVARVTDGPAAIEMAMRRLPDLCLIDTGVPGSGTSAAREICSRLPSTAVVMVAADASEQSLIDSLRAGASGFVTLDSDPARLPATLQRVLAGEAAVPRRFTARLVEEVRTQGRRRRFGFGAGRRGELTSREWEVFELVRGGLTTQEAAARLYVSPVTVRRHMSTAVRKLGVGDRDAALRLLDEAG